jgi:hypothetical protein
MVPEDADGPGALAAVGGDEQEQAVGVRGADLERGRVEAGDAAIRRDARAGMSGRALERKNAVVRGTAVRGTAIRREDG